MAKIVGVIIVIVSSSLVGIYFSDKLKSRSKEIKNINYMFEQISVLVRYKALTVYEIIDCLKQNQICSKLNFIKEFTQKEDISFEIEWSDSIDNSPTYLNREDKRMLKSFGNVFGTSDIDGQLSDVELYRQNFSKIENDAICEYEKKSKLYKSLGVIAGAFISIMLI